MMKKIFFIGRAVGSHRAVVLFSWFLSNGERFCVSYYDSASLAPTKRTLLRRVFFRALRMLRTWMRVVDLLSADCIIVLPMAGDIPKPFLQIARLLGKKVIVDFYISLYDTLVNDRKSVEPGSLQAKILRDYDSSLIRRSTTCVFLTQAERDYYMEVAGENDFSKTKIIPLCSPGQGKAELNFYYGKRNVLHLCWWGTYIPLHGLETIIQACSNLKKGKIPFHLFILGTSDEKGKPYKDLASSLGLDDCITFRNDLRYADGSLLDFIRRECDIALGIFGPSRKAKTVLVNKVVEGLSMGIPVITQPSAGLLEFLEPGHEIEVVDASPVAIAQSVEKLISNKGYAMELASRGLKKYQERFTPEKFLEAFTPLVSEKSRSDV